MRHQHALDLGRVDVLAAEMIMFFLRSWIEECPSASRVAMSPE